MHGLEHGGRVAHVAARRNPRPTDHARHEVADNVAVQIRQHEHIELLRPQHQLLAAVVDDDIVERYIWVGARHILEARRNKPSVHFMMLALCTAVTLRRPCLRAYS